MGLLKDIWKEWKEAKKGIKILGVGYCYGKDPKEVIRGRVWTKEEEDIIRKELKEIWDRTKELEDLCIQAQNDYVDSKNLVCPKCGSTNVEDGGELNLRCKDCSETWKATERNYADYGLGNYDSLRMFILDVLDLYRSEITEDRDYKRRHSLIPDAYPSSGNMEILEEYKKPHPDKDINYLVRLEVYREFEKLLEGKHVITIVYMMTNDDNLDIHNFDKYYKLHIDSFISNWAEVDYLTTEYFKLVE